MKWKNVIVTGGAGFVGTHLVNALVDQAERVVVIDQNKPLKAKKNAKAFYRKLDIRTDDIEEVFKKEKPDVVFHLAAHIDDRESIREPIMNAEHNLIGSINVFEATRKYAKGKMIFASTGGVIYGEQEILPISEDAIPRPLTPYAVSKLTGERYLHFYHQIYDLPYVALRFGNIYGPGQDESAECGAIAIFTARLLKGQEVYINNDGQTTRDYVHVEDVVRALLLAADSDVVGIYNIGTGIETATIDLFDKVRHVIGIEAAPEFREEVEDVIKRSALDAKRAKADLGWESEISLEDGIEKTVQWYGDNV